MPATFLEYWREIREQETNNSIILFFGQCQGHAMSMAMMCNNNEKREKNKQHSLANFWRLSNS